MFVIYKTLDQLEYIEGANVAEIIEPERGHGWIHFKKISFSNSDEYAQITFTAGTEGKPKGIVLSHRALNDVVERLCEITQINSDIREYVGVPAGYSFGLGRFRAIAAVGGSAYVPQYGFDLSEIARMLSSREINAISAVPTLWKTVIANPSLFKNIGDHVRWIEIGSQYMPRADKEQLKQLFPNANITQHYGLTEASRSIFLNISSTQEDLLESVGAATGETAIRISEDGHIEIAGPHVASGRLTTTGVERITDAEGWLRTNDRGELRNGSLYYRGRADDLINCGGIKIIPDQLESTLFHLLQTDHGLGVGRFHYTMRGDGIVIAIERGSGLDPTQVKSAASKALLEQELRAGDALRIIEVDQLPRTDTGKIRRRLIAEQLASYDENESHSSRISNSACEKNTEVGALQTQLTHIWMQVLKTDRVSLDDNFYDNGGDSLTAISMMLALEKAGIEKRITSRIFDGESINEIVNAEELGKVTTHTGRISERVTGDIINIVRGLLVLILIAIHFLPGVFERLPVNIERVNTLLYPFYRFGTPGFALAFGMGVGFFYFKQMANGNAHVWRRVRLSAMIVGIGVLILGAFKYGVFVTSPDSPPSQLFSAVFYSVLTYYFVAVLSIPLWYHLTYRNKEPMLSVLCAAVISFILYVVLDRTIGPEQLSSGPQS